MPTDTTHKFWEEKDLSLMTSDEWESLCDGCGNCCVHKEMDEDTGEVTYTRVACRLLDLETCRCKQYEERTQVVPDCAILVPAMSDCLSWLPPTCAYRRLAQGLSLPDWHPLVTGRADSTKTAGMSIRNRVVSEEELSEPISCGK